MAGNKSISAGYGVHSRLEAPSTYFTQIVSSSGGTSLANKNLDLSKAHHFFAGGKEWQVGRNKQNLIQLNFKVVAGGPARFTPVDLQQSMLKGYTVRDHRNPFSLEDDFYFKPDLKIAFKKNRKASNWSLGLDIMNVTGKTYLTGQWFDEANQKVVNSYDALGMFPNLFYRWEF